jgi:hypothetical protein
MGPLLALLLLAASCAGAAVAPLSLSLQRHRGHDSPTTRSTRSNPITDPLSGGSSMAAYYTDIALGTPAQVVRADPDTGSSDFVVATPQCGCSRWGPGYNPFLSSASIASSCGSNCPKTNSPAFLQGCMRCSMISCGSCDLYVSYADGSAVSGAVVCGVLQMMLCAI